MYIDRVFNNDHRTCTCPGCGALCSPAEMVYWEEDDEWYCEDCSEEMEAE